MFGVKVMNAEGMEKAVAGRFVAKSHRSFASSILEHSGLLRPRNNIKVCFEVPSNLEVVFQDVAANLNGKQYEDLVSAIRDFEIKDDQLCALLREVRRNVALLNKSFYQFIGVLLKLKWANRSYLCCMEYQAFLVDLLSTHNYYTRKVLEALVVSFISEECCETEGDILTDRAKQCCSNIHNVLGILLQVIPMASHVLYEILQAKYPYFRRDANEHRSYVTNILKISLYYPQLRVEILHLVIERLIVLDSNAPRSEMTDGPADRPSEAAELAIFKMEELSGEKAVNPIGHSLDITLQSVFQYVYTSCHDSGNEGNEFVLDMSFQFYDNLIQVFDAVILPTDTTQHVQFLLFYLCSFDRALLETFFGHLWDKAVREDDDIIIKQKAISYLAGMVARAKFVSVGIAQSVLAKLAAWVHDYIERRERMSFVQCKLRLHALFYAVCQAIFYLVAFRHYDLLHPKQNLEFVLKLNIARMVSCQLNPLRVCSPEIIENFVSIASAYQLAYCDPIIERNSRNELPIIHHSEHGTAANPCIEKDVLNAFYPFDSFTLPRSKQVIAPLYWEYRALLKPPQLHPKKCEDDDDFMIELSTSIPDMLTRLSVSDTQDVHN